MRRSADFRRCDTFRGVGALRTGRPRMRTAAGRSGKARSDHCVDRIRGVPVRPDGPSRPVTAVRSERWCCSAEVRRPRQSRSCDPHVRCYTPERGLCGAPASSARGCDGVARRLEARTVVCACAGGVGSEVGGEDGGERRTWTVHRRARGDVRGVPLRPRRQRQYCRGAEVHGRPDSLQTALAQRLGDPRAAQSRTCRATTTLRRCGCSPKAPSAASAPRCDGPCPTSA